MLLHRLDRVLGTARVIAASCRYHWRNQMAVDPEQRQQRPGEHAVHRVTPPIRAAARRSQARNSSTLAPAAELRATRTRSTGGNRERSRRTASRSRRLIRLRMTAFPTFDETVRPTRAAEMLCVRDGSCSRGRKLAASGPSAKLLPRCLMARYSARLRIRASLGKAKAATGPSGGYFLGALTTSRLRPFARRRLRTLRPALVELRLRNPCSRLRRILLGWYVRFTTTASSTESVERKKRGNQPRCPTRVNERPEKIQPPSTQS